MEAAPNAPVHLEMYHVRQRCVIQISSAHPTRDLFKIQETVAGHVKRMMVNALSLLLEIERKH